MNATGLLEEDLDSPVQRRLLELAELLPLTFWRHLDRMNVHHQRKPRWNFLINQTGVQCNIFWENKSEDDRTNEETDSEVTLQKADDWLRAANETDPETINPDDVQKTIQSLLEIITENNKISNGTQDQSAKKLTTENLSQKHAGEKRKVERLLKPTLIAPKVRKISNQPVQQLTWTGNVKDEPTSSKLADNGTVTYRTQPVASSTVRNGVRLGSLPITSTVSGLSPNSTVPTTAIHPKGTKILCYMPSNLTKVKIPIKIQNLNNQNNNLSGVTTVIGAATVTNVTASSTISSPSPKSSTLIKPEPTPTSIAVAIELKKEAEKRK